jgi:deoxyribodipyrimidine photo-lyase
MYDRSVFVFRRDLRVPDNTALTQCLLHSKHTFACFIFTPEQIGSRNPYNSHNCVQFMVQCITDLRRAVPTLHTFYGKPTQVLQQLHDVYDFQAVFVNADYTPYAVRRDADMRSWCKRANVKFHSYEDYALLPMLGSAETVLTQSGDPYKKFTPFYNTAKTQTVRVPSRLRKVKFVKLPKLPCDYDLKSVPYRHNSELYCSGGRREALRVLRNLRNTTNTGSDLSAYNKFGCVSVREVYYWTLKHKKSHPQETERIIRNLYWRDFYYRIVWYFPDVIVGSDRNFRSGTQKWKTNTAHFRAWCTARTGVPIVDAGMTQLVRTGYISNRLRLIVASFLVKDLHINWESGEKYFAQHLVDYDPAQNNGNWQWVAGTGTDAQPYYRIFNPWNQSAKYDPDAVYIKHWLPVLANVPASHIHQWHVYCKEHARIKYPVPIVDHDKEKRVALDIVRKK